MSIFGLPNVAEEEQIPLFGAPRDPVQQAVQAQLPPEQQTVEAVDQLDQPPVETPVAAEPPVSFEFTPIEATAEDPLVMYDDPIYGEIQIPASVAKASEEKYKQVGTFRSGEDGELEWGDYGAQIAGGGAGVVEGIGWGISQLGFQDAGEVIQYYGKNAVDYWHEKLSDNAKQELAKEFIKVDENGEYSFGDASWRTAALLGAGSLLGTAAGAGVGAGVTKVLQVFANPVGRGVLQSAVLAGEGAAAGSKAALEAASALKKLKMVDSIMGAAGFGIGEGVIGGTSAGASVRDQMMTTPQEVLDRNQAYQTAYASTQDMGMSEDDRRLYARSRIADQAAWEAGSRTLLATTLLGAPMGAFFGRMMGSRAVKAIDSKLSTRLVAGGGGEALQESVQSGTEQVISNVAQMKYDDTKISEFEGVANAMVGGAVAGGPLGALMAAPGNAKRPDDASATEPSGPKAVIADALKRGVPQADIDAVMSQKGSPIQKLRAIRELVPRETTGEDVLPSIGEQEDLGEITTVDEEETPSGAPVDPVDAAEKALASAIGQYGESPKRAVAKKEIDRLRQELSAARDTAEGAADAQDKTGAELLGSPQGELRAAKQALAEATRQYGDKPASQQKQSRLRSLEQRVAQAETNVAEAETTREPGEDTRQRFARVEKERHAYRAAEKSLAEFEMTPANPTGETKARETKLAELRADVEQKKNAYDEIRKAEGVQELSPEDQAIADAANEAATSPTNDLPLPTKKQKEAGRYRKGKIQAYGLEIEIENPAGSVREGEDEDGKPYKNTMQGHYGYIKSASGADDEPLDVMIGTQIGGNRKAEYVYVVDQTDAYGDFDEHKVLMGYGSRNDAEDAYVGSYEKGWDRYSDITQMTKREFKAWVAAGDKTKPVSEVLFSRKKKLLDGPEGGGIKNSDAVLSPKTERAKLTKEEREVAKAAKVRAKAALDRKLAKARKSEADDQAVAKRIAEKNKISPELQEALISAGKNAKRVLKDADGDVIESAPDPIPASMVIAQAASDMASAKQSRGWVPLTEIKSVEWTKAGKVEITWKTQKWEFAQDANGKRNDKTEGPRARRMANKLTAEIRNVQKRAEDGDEAARSILRAAHWYSNMTYYLRLYFGGATDLVADLLGATSPQTPVSTNYKNTIDILKQLSTGKLTGPIRRFEAYMNAGNSISQYMKDPANEAEIVVHSITGKKYGINSMSVLKALAGFLRAHKKGDSAKMSSFSANLAGAGQLATIDVWAARTLQRLWSNGKRRIHPSVQDGVKGKLTKDSIGSVDGDYRFGAKVFDMAAEQLDMDPHELQAMAWFMEKEIWSANQWTTAEGEGGSFEKELAEHDLRRIVIGISAQLGSEAPPVDLVQETEGLLNRMSEQSGAVAWRVQNSQGFYDTEEQAWDMEVVADANFNYMIFVRRLAALAKRNFQDSFLVARPIDAMETHPNGRPGLEIYIKQPGDIPGLIADLQKFVQNPRKWGSSTAVKGVWQDLKKTMDLLEAGDGSVELGGFTFITNPMSAYKDENGVDAFIGLRVLFVPELRARMDDKYADRIAANPALAEVDYAAADRRLKAAVQMLSENESVHQIFYGDWDVSAVTWEHYDEVRKGSVVGRGTAARGDWEPVSRSIALQTAAEENRRRRQSQGERFIRESPVGSSEGSLNFSRSLMARSAEVAPEVPAGQWRTTVEQHLTRASEAVKGAVRVRIVQSHKDIPIDVPGDVEGLYHKASNTVYIVSSNLGSLQRASEVFLHEVFGHSAMEMLVPQFDSVLSALTVEIERGKFGTYVNRAIASEGEVPSPRRLAKEVIAQMAEEGVDVPIIREAIAVFRSLLRKLGLKLRMSEGDIRLLISKAARAASNGRAVQLPVTTTVELLQNWTHALLGDGDLSYDQLNAMADDPEEGRYIARMPIADVNRLAGYEALRGGNANGEPKAVHLWVKDNVITGVAGGGVVSAAQNAVTVVFHTEGKAPGGILKGEKGAVASPAVMTKVTKEKRDEIIARYGPASGQDVFIEQSQDETDYFDAIANDRDAYEAMLDEVPGAYISPRGEFMVPRGSSARAAAFLASGPGAPLTIRNGSFTRKLMKEAQYVEAATAPKPRRVEERRGARGEDWILESEGWSDYIAAPLEHAPENVKVDGKDMVYRPFAPAREAAARYAQGRSTAYEPITTFAKVDRQRARAVAREFEKMEHNPEDPEVKAAYAAMIEETLAQYRAILETGLTVEFIDFNVTGDPYGNPRNVMEDVAENNHMWIFSTREGFGTEEEVLDSPMLAETEFEISGQKMLANDVFRVVHDYFGHIKDGVGFRAEGEENAWRSHARMYSTLARRAVTTETRGQNSWVNFGPHARANQDASGSDTVYATQKVGLLPEWVSEVGLNDSLYSQQRFVAAKDEFGFYSALEQAVYDLELKGWKDNEPVRMERVIAAIKKHPKVKPEELDWSGLLPWMEMYVEMNGPDVPKGTITVADLRFFFTENGGFRLVEKVSSSNATEIDPDDYDLDWQDEEYDPDPDYIEQLADESMDEVLDSSEGQEWVFDRAAKESMSEVNVIASVLSKEGRLYDRFRAGILLPWAENYSRRVFDEEGRAFANLEIGERIASVEYNRLDGYNAWDENGEDIPLPRRAGDSEIIRAIVEHFRSTNPDAADLNDNAEDDAQFHSYVGDAVSKNYREIRIQLPDSLQRGEYPHQDHWGDGNTIASMIVGEKEVSVDMEEGNRRIVRSYHIIETQSDIHKAEEKAGGGYMRGNVVTEADIRESYRENFRVYVERAKNDALIFAAKTVTAAVGGTHSSTPVVTMLSNNRRSARSGEDYLQVEMIPSDAVSELLVAAWPADGSMDKVFRKPFGENKEGPSPDQLVVGRNGIYVIVDIKRSVLSEAGLYPHNINDPASEKDRIAFGRRLQSEYIQEIQTDLKRAYVEEIGARKEASNEELLKRKIAEQMAKAEASKFDLPYKNKAWTKLVFNRMLLNAVQQGYGVVSWSSAADRKRVWPNEDVFPVFDAVYDQKLPDIAKKMGLVPVQDKRYWTVRLPDDVIQSVRDSGLPYFSRKPKQASEDAGEVLFSRRAKLSSTYEAIAERVMDRPMEDLTLMDRMMRLKQRFSLWDKGSVKQGMLDAGYSIKRMERMLTGGSLLDASDSAYKAYVATKSVPSVMAAIFSKGAPIMKDGILQIMAGRKGLQDIFNQLRDENGNSLLHAWEVYAAARRADRLINEKNPDGTSRENNFTRDEIDAILAEGSLVKAPDGSALFEKVFDEWQDFNNTMLDLAVSTGAMDADVRDLWRTNDYVPFFRAMEMVASDTLAGTGGAVQGGLGNAGLSGQKVDSMRLHGSDKKIAGTVFENMIMNTAYIVDTILKHNAMERIVDMGEGAVMTKVPLAAKPVRFTGEQLARAMLAGGLINPPPNHPSPATYAREVVDRMTPAQQDSWQTLFKRVAPVGDGIVSVMRNGKMEYFEVIDKLLLRSINAIGTRSFDGLMWQIFRKPKHWLTTLITADPAFMLANFARDTLSAFVTSNAGIIPGYDSVKGLYGAITEDPLIMQIMMAGSGGGGFYEKSDIDLRKLIAQKQPKGGVERFMRSIVKMDNQNGLWRLWMRIGSASENANRLAIARRVLEKGGTLAEAAYQAQDIMNFSMRGDSAALGVLIETVPFLNARIQGLYRLGRGAKENPQAFAMKGMLIMAASMALLLQNDDNEKYDELDEWDKDTYWHVFIGDDHYRIPKPFEVGVMFATVPERMVNALRGDESWSLFRDRMLHSITETLAFNPIPQVLRPAVEDFFNYSMFTKRPIVGMSLDGLPPEDQYEAYTGATVREFAKGMPDWAPDWLRSPKRLEALFRGYFGSLGMYAMQVSDALTRGAANYPERPAMRITEAPVLSRFVRPEIAVSTKYQEMLYEFSETANEMARSVKRTAELGDLARARELKQEHLPKLQVRKEINAIRADVTKINTKIRLISFSKTLSAEEKRERLDRLHELKNKTLRQVAKYQWAF